MKHGKRYKKAAQLANRSKHYPLEEAVKIVKQSGTAKFDESIDVAVRLGVDPRQADQIVRGTVALPHGIGKSVRVLVITKTQEAAAKEAGADMVGFDEYLTKIKEGWTDTDVIVATPEVMGDLGKLGKILGPRGLMPNPKSGTVTQNVGSTVKEIKGGKIEFRTDKTGILHAMIGKASFPEEKILENARTFLHIIMKMKPTSAKGQYVKSVTISTTMGPGIRIDRAEVV